MRKYLAAVVQTDSRKDKQENCRNAEGFIAAAAAKGAKLVVLPEMMNFLAADCRKGAEPIPGPASDFLCAQAKKHGIWLAGGSIPEIPGQYGPDGSNACKQQSALPMDAAISENIAHPLVEHAANTLLFIDPAGQILCSYRKMHMFDVDIEEGTSYRESASTLAGDQIVLCDTPLGRIGFAICYDLRFCELFRLMALEGAQIICLPANFTLESGKDHWETLLRARAIENGVYVLAANQCGKKSFMNAYGNSMIVDPWGTVIARCGGRPGIALAEIDLDYLDSVRRQIPSLKNRREDLYSLSARDIAHI